MNELVAHLESSEPILALGLGDLLPLRCEFRVLGVLQGVRPRVQSARGTIAGEFCDDLTAQRSGHDTLRISVDGAETELPIVVAIAPTVTPGLGTALNVDSLPTGVGPWAPSARINSQGQTEIYFAGYYPEKGQGNGFRGHLHRLVSDDGERFVYDGIALEHDEEWCSLNGSGIENIEIVPRHDGEGWRMFYASGSFGCYGWQVFSAVSTDERTWVKEPGVRLDNGGTVPPASPTPAPWPVGEGMVTDRLPSGQWRMIVSGYERLQPREDKFQIVEWRSPDQLHWTYVGPVFTTRSMPREGQASVYSPTIMQIAPGLWRMFFTADNRHDPDGRSGIWTAVSTDKRQWILEREAVGAPGIWIRYSALANDRLVFVQRDSQGARALAIATVITR